MFGTSTQIQTEERGGVQARGATAAAVVVGVALGALFSWLWPHFAGPAALGLWLAGLALGLMGVALASGRRGQARWGLAITGQLVGVTAAVAFLLASVG
jgi:hypothetical protein